MNLSKERNGSRAISAGRKDMEYYGHSQIERVCKYVLNQEEHHRKKTFRQEYLEFLEKFSIPFEEKYLFEWIE